MKTLQTILFLTLITLFSNGQGVWTQEASFPGIAEGDAFYFSIGNMGYTGAGAEANTNVLNDFWQYDAINNIWTQKASFAGTARWQGVAFSIGSKGYVGLGSGLGYYNDFWEYDPASDTWTQKASLPADGRTAGIGFSIGNKGYVGTGWGCSPIPCINTNHNDFWEYDPLANSWTQKAVIPINGRSFGYGLSIGSKGYMGGGHDSTGYTFDDFWEYNPATDTWIQKANYPGGPRGDIDGAHFTIGNYGYVGTGYYPAAANTFNDFWRYDPSTDSWSQIPNLPAQSRIGAIGFSLNNKGYTGTGYWFTNVAVTLTDLWSFTDTTLNQGTGINEINSYNLITIFPNPLNDKLTVTINNNDFSEIILYDIASRKLLQQSFTNTTTINTKLFAKGIYLYEVRNKNGVNKKGKLVKE